MKTKRQYNPQLNSTAFHDVTGKGVSVYKEARMYSIPPSTFSRNEEMQLVDHLNYVASIGYENSRQEFLTFATDFAISLGKPDSGPIFAIQVLNLGVQMLL